MNEEYSPETKAAFERIRQLDDIYDEIGPEEYLDRLDQLSPEFIEVYGEQNMASRKGEALLDMDRYHEAIPLFEKAIELGNVHPQDRFILDCTNNLAWCYLNTGQVARALELYEDAESLLGIYEEEGYTGSLISYYLGRGRSYAYLERYKEAIEWFEKAVEIIPDVSLSSYQLAILKIDLASALARDNSLQEGLRLMREIASVAGASDWASVYFSRFCHLLSELKLNDELVKVAEKFIKLNQEDSLAEAWYYYGLGCAGLGKEEEARRSVKNSLKFPDPGGHLHANAREYLKLTSDGWK